MYQSKSSDKKKIYFYLFVSYLGLGSSSMTTHQGKIVESKKERNIFSFFEDFLFFFARIK